MKKLIYIAGPLRGKNVTDYITNVHNMIKQGEIIRKKGFAVYIPCLDLLHGLVIGDLQFEDYFTNSLEVLKRCDGVFLCEGYENSEGTLIEIREADDSNIPIFSSIEELSLFFNNVRN